jgi:hypothetical protein
MQKSAMGRSIDMSMLVSKNEKVRAVGNMKVNARGDIIDSHNRVVQENTQRVKSSYTNTVTENAPSTNTAPAVADIDVLSIDEQTLFDEEDEDTKQ